MSNQQFDYVVSLARDLNINLSHCPTCRKLRVEVAPGIWIWEPSTYKLYNQVHDCDCAWQEELQRHYLLAGIPRHYWTLSENDWFGDSYALESAQTYLDNWETWKYHGMGIEFFSPTLGTGKTMLATLIAKRLIQREERVYFTYFRDMVRLFHLPPEQREFETHRLRTTTVVVLDEVGVAISDAQRDFFAEQLEELIRFRTSGNSVTLVTTNMTPDDLERDYPRTFSLLQPKQHHIRVRGMDARQSGKLDQLTQEMILHNEARPLT